MLRVVEKRHGVVIAAKQQDLPISIGESLEQRTAAEGIAPWLRLDEMTRETSPDDEPGDVGVDQHTP